MNRLVFTMGTAAAIFMGGAMISDRTSASPLGVPGAKGALEGIDLAQNAQANWCFYVDGWNGPGFYICGQHRRRGFGWHGNWDSRTHSSWESRRHSTRWSSGHGRRDSSFHSYRESSRRWR
jgi:hypothetical protein